MNYYDDYIQIYLFKLKGRYVKGSKEEKEKVIHEIENNKNLKQFQKEYIKRVVKNVEPFPRIKKDKLFIKYE